MQQKTGGIRELELQLAELLGTPRYARDDQRLSRVYRALAEEFRPQMDPMIADVFQQLSGGAALSAEDRQRLLANVRLELRGLSGASLAGMLYEIADACLRPGFTIDPDTGTYPIYALWKLGLPVGRLEEILGQEYPEIAA